VEFTRDGRFVYEGEWGGGVRFWNLATLQLSVQLSRLWMQADDEDLFEEDGVSDDEFVVVGGIDPRRRRAGNNDDSDYDVARLPFALTKDGSRVVAAHHYDSHCSPVIEKEDLELLLSGPLALGEGETCSTIEQSRAASEASGRDIQRASASLRREVVEVWDLESAQVLRSLETGARIRSVAIEGNDRFILIELAEERADEESGTTRIPPMLLVWDLNKDKVVRRIAGGWGRTSVSRDERTLRYKDAAGKRKTFTLKSVGSEIDSSPCRSEIPLVPGHSHRALLLRPTRDNSTDGIHFEGHKDWVTGLVVLPDSMRIASSSRDGTVRLWDSSSGEQFDKIVKQMDQEVLALALSPDGQLLVAAGANGMVLVHSLATNQRVSQFTASTKAINAVLFADHDTFFTGGDGGHLRKWSTAGSEIPLHWQGTSDEWRLENLAQSVDSKKLVVKWVHGGVAVYDLMPDALVKQHSFGVRNNTWSLMALSPDTHIVAVPDTEPVVRRWDVHTGKELQSFALPKGTRGFAIAFSPDGNSVALGDRDGRVFVLDARSGETLAVWEGHDGMVTSVVFLDNANLASGGTDTTVLMWRLQTSQ
jgi:WD40 repeat protein